MTGARSLPRSARPSISSAPQTVNYGESFFLGTPNPTSISRVTWVRLGSVTHAFDMGQRFIEQSFVRTTGGLTIKAPTDPKVAPPGHYFLFILNGNGVPSVARIVRIV